MNVIYEPRGAAREYAPLAANLYRGCGHGCTYCYAPACLRLKADTFRHAPQPRPGVLEALVKDARRLRSDPRRVLFCFACDPYQPIEAEHKITRRALQIMANAGLRVAVLTKNPRIAMRDLDVMADMDVQFGVTLCWVTDTKRREWEPNAGTVEHRLAALEWARAAGMKTWVSVEPVIDATEAVAVVRHLAGKVDMLKVGKLNHMREIEARTDWPTFGARVEEICKEAGQALYIKNDLRHAMLAAPSRVG